MPDINQQTPGPVFVERDQIETDSGISIASVCGPNASARRVERDANRRLLASAYTAFDKAGRELDIDAAELAQTINIGELLQCLSSLSDLASKAHADVKDKRLAASIDKAVVRAKKQMNALAHTS